MCLVDESWQAPRRGAAPIFAERHRVAKHVISVSLGSASRDHLARTDLFGEPFVLERIGTDGSLRRAEATLRRLDGTVDAFGLGGIDIYLYAGTERFALRDGLRLRDAAVRTPVVDGGGLKNTIERDAVAFLGDELGVDLHGRRVLMVSALDRFGMAQAFAAAGADVLFGDFIFALDLDKPVRDIAEFEALAKRYLPDACKLPFQFLYPTGRAQDRPPQPKYAVYYDEAEILAGDFHFLRRYMPPRLDGKIVLTNTVTAADTEDLAARGVACVVTTTPAFDGRSFGTNVVEAALVAYLGGTAGTIAAGAYADAVAALGLRPRIVYRRVAARI